MKMLKLNSLERLIAFVLITVLLLCVVGFAAGGRQSAPTNEPDSGEVGNNTDNTDENTDGNNQSTSTTPPSNKDENSNPETNRYYNTLTGLEVSEQQYLTCPIGFTVNPELPIYGISSSDLTIEFPIENGKSRLLSYTTNNTVLWKVGSLAPTRAFISASSNFFGGVVVSYGNDDIIKYSVWDASKINLDVSKISGCYYVENTLYIYTSGDMVNSALQNAHGLESTEYKAPPYIFSNGEVHGNTVANSVVLPYSSQNETELYYSDSTGKYSYYKAGTRKNDMLTGKNIAFTNVFVLFANATTYEKADGTELIVDNTSGGSGYYISKGTLTEIKWSIDEGGALIFTKLNGEKLSVNRGNAYIGYFKASMVSSVKIG